MCLEFNFKKKNVKILLQLQLKGPLVKSDQVDISARLKSRIVQRAFGINRMKFVDSNEVAFNLPGKWLLSVFKSRREFRQTMIKVALDVGLPSLTF